MRGTHCTSLTPLPGSLRRPHPSIARTCDRIRGDPHRWERASSSPGQPERLAPALPRNASGQTGSWGTSRLSLQNNPWGWACGASRSHAGPATAAPLQSTTHLILIAQPAERRQTIRMRPRSRTRVLDLRFAENSAVGRARRIDATTPTRVGGPCVGHVILWAGVWRIRPDGQSAPAPSFHARRGALEHGGHAL